ncbi:MAG: hypothetical protein K2N36_04360, partial [Ruminiclostridium sp.]|nr:hypothetical protein [Ruminiclostridium sp.]
MFDCFLGEDRRCIGQRYGSSLFGEDRRCFGQRYASSLFWEDQRCFGERFGFSIFEEIENAFVRSFLQSGCLKSEVLDLPFYCELSLDPLMGVDGGKASESRDGESFNNRVGGSERCFDNCSCNYFNNYYDNVSLSCFEYYYGNWSLSGFNGRVDSSSQSRAGDFSDHGFLRGAVFDGSNG